MGVYLNMITSNNSNIEFTKQDKVISLFKFIEELNKLKQKVVLNVSEYPWYRTVSSLPEDPENIKVYYRDRVEDEDVENTSDVLLSVHKPEFQKCPIPDSCLEGWLKDGWNDYRLNAHFKEYIYHVVDADGNDTSKDENVQLTIDESVQTTLENFTDDEKRVRAYNVWIKKRNPWAEKQRLLAKTRNLFSELYKISIDLERESETLELVVADGFIQDKNLPSLNHPILTRRVKIRHDAQNNTIYIEDTDVETELYTVMFQNMEDINLSSINRMSDDLHKNDYHPLDRNDLPSFLKIFIHQLSSESIYSEDGIPENWKSRERFLLYRNPCYILRKRIDGTLKAIEQIIEHVEETGEVPNPISDIVDGGKIDIPEDTEEASIEEQLAAVGGESVDILLSKEANKEQLEIARRIERYNAVLVQGPPGTGKTHTIANLMGHFLAQGKSVLVTSQTQKALSVLKEKIAPGLQNLCVTMLDDSNVDMEKSIDGITSYMSHYTSFEVKKEMDSLAAERKNIISELAATRKKIFSIINKECNCIVYNGEDISPSAAASFVQENSESLSYIPGNVKLYEPLPLSLSELSELYRSNELISNSDEAELSNDLPNPEDLISPHEFEKICAELQAAKAALKQISKNNNWEIQNLPLKHLITLATPFGKMDIPYPDVESVDDLKNYLSTLSKIDDWMQHCAVDGMKSDNYRQLWIQLIEQIEKSCEYADAIIKETFGKDVKITNHDPSYVQAMTRLYDKLSSGGKVGKLALMMNKQFEIALNGATINGQQPQSSDDCKLILHVLEMSSLRNQCAVYWDDLMAKHGLPKFYDLSENNPERIAAHYINPIKRYLDWFNNEFSDLTMRMNALELPCDVIFQKDELDSEIVMAEKILSAVSGTIPTLCRVFDTVKIITDNYNRLKANHDFLISGKRINSSECKNLAIAADKNDIQSYRNIYDLIDSTYAKTSIKNIREEYLERIEVIAPQWADSIRRRVGIHGTFSVPSDIENAWKWKQYYGIIEEITAEPFSELQKKSLSLSKEYRKITAKYAEKSAWYHLLRRTESDIDMKQALIGWKLTVKKIGKGTGKNAPTYRAEARKLMVKCQKAVPAWIMPIGKALESLNPKQNKFDIIIIDEASQSDISSLAILYMGKKLIIVGDDKQVSPMAVGVQLDKMNSLKDMYITGKIPNAHLYDAKTSIYDIAATTFQPLMLCEHFRCVPEIIGFSNYLSYDFKIKPLRDCSNSVLLPAVVNYRVEDGERIGKTNPNEAKTIVALMKACMAQPEYANKTFGVISMLGDEQVKVIQSEIYKNIDPKDCTLRRILCGNASNFQGDERDVIFLSLVECANGRGPVSKQEFGVDDAYRKRYNVAASRAKDQLWVVDSLDPANDLKPGDIRKKLIDYSLNPDSVLVAEAKIEEKSESPFEEAVARYLTLRGYHLIQQWSVGAYRLDMVAVCGKKKVAIECDGERFHSGESKIREDMERQTILERLGWQFIRLRGSEYYSNPDKAMDRVVSELTALGIEPEEASIVEKTGRNTDLLQRVKIRAHQILTGQEPEDTEPSIITVSVALDPKNDVIGTTEEPEPIKIDRKESVFEPKAIPEIENATADDTENPAPEFTDLSESVVSEKTAPLSEEANEDRPEITLEETKEPEVIPMQEEKTEKTVHKKNVSKTARRTTSKKKSPSPAQKTTVSKTSSESKAVKKTPPRQNISSSKEIINLLEQNNVKYTDNRSKGGGLWIIGGKELSGIVKQAKELGFNFHFKEEGGRATKHQPGWWV